MLSACGSGQDGDSGENSIVIAVTAEPDTLDPYAGKVSGVVTQIFEPLYGVNTSGEVEPVLASGPAKNVDETTWEVPLREGVTFQDGTPLDAKAAAESLTYLLSLEEVPEAASRLYAAVDKVEAKDDLTLRFTLRSFLPNLESALVKTPIAKAENADRESSPIGTGPYELAEWNRGTAVKLKLNPDYWGTKPSVEQVEFRVIPDAATQLASLSAGEIDLMLNVPIEDRERVGNVKEYPSADFPVVVLNTIDGVTSDVRVRQALNYAVDKEKINAEILDGTGRVPACQFAFEGYEGFDPDLKAYAYDPEKARDLIKQAGAENAKISLLALSEPGALSSMKEVLIDSWKQIGLDATLEVADQRAYIDAVLDKSRRPAAYFVTIGSGAEHSAAGIRPYVVIDPKGQAVSHNIDEISDLYKKASQESEDSPERVELLQEMSKQICDNALFVNLPTIPQVVGYSDRIDDIGGIPNVEDEFRVLVKNVTLAQ